MAAHMPSEATTKWLMPLRLTDEDGQTVQVVARAIDEAGNVGPSSEPMVITLDNKGPWFDAEIMSMELGGSISDGSGVASMRVSLDGGQSYQDAVLMGRRWRFNLSDWVGGLPQGFALLQAQDVWGNVSQSLLPMDPSRLRYFPLISVSR